MTLELLFSLGLAAVAFGSYLAYHQSVCQQQTQLKHFAAGTFLLQSTMEQIRSGEYGASIEKLNWAQPVGEATNRWLTSTQQSGVFAWQLASEASPVRGEIFPFKVILTWDERGNRRTISAATQLLLK